MCADFCYWLYRITNKNLEKTHFNISFYNQHKVSFYCFLSCGRFGSDFIGVTGDNDIDRMCNKFCYGRYSMSFDPM
jgi:hypothetical protein